MSLVASEDTANYWYVSEAGQTYGPLTLQMVEKRLATNSFGRTALVWKNGWKTWQPIAAHFSTEIPTTRRPADEAKHFHTDGHQARSISAVLRWLLFLITAAAFAAFEYGIPFLDVDTPNSFVALRLAIVGALSVGGIFAVRSWWGYSKRARSGRQGIIRVVTVLWGAVITVVTVAAVTSAPFGYRMEVARQNFKHYTVQTDVLTGTLYIKGLVGPGLSRIVKTQLDANSGIKNVQIDSFGG
ncbi:MAG TPA: DUF4339 domain-containing protein, partial [Rhizomicrobium sp.]